jgi:hypothetical protein
MTWNSSVHLINSKQPFIPIETSTCLKAPPNDSKISHLFNTNKSTCNAHNDLVFQYIYICQTFILEAIDIPQGSMPLTYHLPNDPNKTIT